MVFENRCVRAGEGLRGSQSEVLSASHAPPPPTTTMLWPKENP